MFSPEDIFSLPLEKEEVREKVRDKHRCQREALTVCFPYVTGPGIVCVWICTRDQTHNLGMCLDQELKARPVGYDMILQTTELHWARPQNV